MAFLRLLQKHKMLIVFVFLQTFLYLGAIKYHSILPFKKEAYILDAHHFLEDARIHGGEFNLLRALGQFDAQWYLKIANDGYPSHPMTQSLNDKTQMGSLRYAFYPLYPATIALFNIFFNNIEVSAFVLTNIILILDFLSLHFVVSKIYDKTLARKTVALLFLFPFSVFLRSYYAEGLFLLLLVWFSYFLFKKNYLYAAVALCFLNIVKANGMLLNFLFLFILIRNVYLKKISLPQALLSLTVTMFAYLCWVLFVFKQTGDPFYFYTVLKAWYSIPLFPPPPFYAICLVLLAPFVPFMHVVHFSQIDAGIAVLTLLLLIKSRKFLSKELWFISFSLWVLPIFTRDLASFSRYQSVSFPFFIYLAHVLKSKSSFTLACIFLVAASVITLLCFVNWYWIG